MKNLNDTIVHAQLFFVDAIHNQVSNYSISTRWPKIIVSVTNTGFVFIFIVRFGNVAILRNVWQHDINPWGRDINLWTYSVFSSSLKGFN